MSIAMTTTAAPSANTVEKPQIFFDSHSTSNTSNNFVVNKEPWYIEAFNFANGDTVTVQQVAGPGSGTLFQNFEPGNAPLQLSTTQTKIRVDWPGTYRLVFSGAAVAATLVRGFPGTMTQESTIAYSLAFGASNPVFVDGAAPIVVTGNGTSGSHYVVSLPGQTGTPGVPVDGSDSVFIGDHAGIDSTGSQNVFIGTQAGATSSGSDNVFVGRQAGTTTHMNNSVCVGIGAGQGSNSTNGVYIGFGAGASDPNNNVIIIANAVGLTSTAANYAMIGDNTITHMVTAGSVIAGGAISASDSRLKKGIAPLKDALVKLNALEPVEFSWDARRLEDAGLPHLKSDLSKRHSGVIAQDFAKVFPEAVEQVAGRDGELYFFVHYDRIIPSLLSAIQELSARVITLESRRG